MILHILLYARVILEKESSNLLLSSCLSVDYWSVDPQAYYIIVGCIVGIVYHFSSLIA